METINILWLSSYIISTVILVVICTVILQKMNKGVYISEFFCRLGANNSPLQNHFKIAMAIFGVLSFSLIFNISHIISNTTLLPLIQIANVIISAGTVVVAIITIDENKPLHDFAARLVFFAAFIFSVMFMSSIDSMNILGNIVQALMYLLVILVSILIITEIPKLLNLKNYQLLLPFQRATQWISILLIFIWNISLTTWIIYTIM